MLVELLGILLVLNFAVDFFHLALGETLLDSNFGLPSDLSHFKLVHFLDESLISCLITQCFLKLRPAVSIVIHRTTSVIVESLPFECRVPFRNRIRHLELRDC